MRFADILTLSIKNVSRGKSRVCLSVIAVAVGIASVIMLASVGNTANNFIEERLGGIGLDGLMVYAGEQEKLSPKDAADIAENIKGIKSSMPFEFWFAYCRSQVSNREPCLILGSDETISQYMDIEVISGRELNFSDCASQNYVCLADKRLGVSGSVGQKIILEVNGKSFEFTVVGVCSSSVDMMSGMLGIDIPPFIYVPWTSLCDTEEAELGQIVLKLENGADSTETAEKVRSYLKNTKNNGKAFDIEDMSAYRKQFGEIIDIVTLVLSGTAAISLFVAALGIMSSMLSGVSERKCEIGVCKSIGATSFQICLLFLLEAVIIAVLGCIIGVSVGLCVLYTVFYVLFEAVPQIEITPVLIPCILSLAVGLISGVVPALSAARMSPVNAIRKE